MAVTFTPAAEREVRWRRERASGFLFGDRVLVATSCVVALAIGLAYVGRLAALERSDRTRAGAAINLNVVEHPDVLEQGLATAFPNADDRQFAAREWLRFLTTERESGRRLP